METIGQKLSPVLEEIENTLWQHEANFNTPPQYTEAGFRAAVKIFMSVIMDKAFDLCIDENFELTDGCNMAQKCGEDIRKLVKTYTNIDTADLYK